GSDRIHKVSERDFIRMRSKSFARTVSSIRVFVRARMCFGRCGPLTRMKTNQSIQELAGHAVCPLLGKCQLQNLSCNKGFEPIGALGSWREKRSGSQMVAVANNNSWLGKILGISSFGGTMICLRTTLR